jgi:hypothetical protein
MSWKAYGISTNGSVYGLVAHQPHPLRSNSSLASAPTIERQTSYYGTAIEHFVDLVEKRIWPFEYC